MKKTYLFTTLILFVTLSVAQTTTNTQYYDQYGNKIGSSKGIIIEKPEYKFVSQFVPENLDAQQAFFDRLQKTNDDNLRQVNFLIDWIIDSKNKTNDQILITGLTKYYGQLKDILAQQELQLPETTHKIQEINFGLKDEVDSYYTRQKELENNRIKELPKKYWESGNSNMKEGNYTKAINDFTNLIELNPGVPDGYLKRAKSYLSNGNYSLALLDLNKYIELKTNESEAYYCRGFAKRELKDYVGAMSDFNKLIELSSNNSLGYFERARVKSELGDYNGSISDNTKAIELEPDNSMAYNNRGWDKYSLKKYSDALIDLNKAIQLDNTNWVAYDSRQETKFALNDLKGCVEDCNSAISLNPKCANSYLIRGRAFYKQSNKTKACEDWSKAGELGKTEAYEFIQKYCNK